MLIIYVDIGLSGDINVKPDWSGFYSEMNLLPDINTDMIFRESRDKIKL